VLVNVGLNVIGGKGVNETVAVGVTVTVDVLVIVKVGVMVVVKTAVVALTVGEISLAERVTVGVGVIRVLGAMERAIKPTQ